MTITDPIERIVAEALRRRDTLHYHESQPLVGHGIGADFYLPGYDVLIECKQFYTPRIDGQLSACPNIILIQGRKAAETFAALIGGKS